MRDKIIQDIAPIIHSYYQARGIGLEKTCNQVIDKVEESSSSTDIVKCKNVFRLTTTGINVLRYHKNDKLVVIFANELIVYEGDSVDAYKTQTIGECKWRLVDDFFGGTPTTVTELLDKGAAVHLMRVL